MKRLIIFFGLFLYLAVPAYAANGLGTLHESVTAGKVISIGLNTSPTGWFLGTNSNPATASFSIVGSNLIIRGLTAGTSVLSACTDQQLSNCLGVTVDVQGSVLGASISAHAPGSWVISGQTVFYITSNGIIPITTWPIFLNNGGKSKLIQPANPGDLGLPLLPFMVINDSRVN